MRKTTATETYLKVRHGKRKDLGSKFFRSSYEANYARYLNWMLENKIKWDNEVRLKKWTYEEDTFWFLKIKRGVRSFTPDFKLYFSDGSIVYHEVKGWYDAKSKTKIKRMRIYHKKVKLILVDGKWFKAMTKKGNCRLIPNWEPC